MLKAIVNALLAPDSSSTVNVRPSRVSSVVYRPPKKSTPDEQGEPCKAGSRPRDLFSGCSHALHGACQNAKPSPSRIDLAHDLAMGLWRQISYLRSLARKGGRRAGPKGDAQEGVIAMTGPGGPAYC